jgi:hypothetical protein
MVGATHPPNRVATIQQPNNEATETIWETIPFQIPRSTSAANIANTIRSNMFTM